MFPSLLKSAAWTELGWPQFDIIVSSVKFWYPSFSNQLTLFPGLFEVARISILPSPSKSAPAIETALPKSLNTRCSVNKP